MRATWCWILLRVRDNDPGRQCACNPTMDWHRHHPFSLIGLINKRLSDTSGEEFRKTYDVIGEPKYAAGAAVLAEQDK